MDKIIDFDLIKLDYSRRKICKCKEKKYTIDTTNRLVYCECGVIVDEFEVLKDLTRRLQHEVEIMNLSYYEKVELLNYKPYLRGLKSLEGNLRKDMLPCCPKCSQLFKIEDITSYTHKGFYKEKL